MSWRVVRSGYTLMEILAVASIVATVASIALPAASNFFATAQASASAKTFLSDARYGRFEAIRTGQPHRMVLSNLTAKNTYRVEVLSLDPETDITNAQFNNNNNWYSVLEFDERELDPEVLVSLSRATPIFFTPQGKLVEDWVIGQEERPMVPRAVHFNYADATMTVTLTAFGGFSSTEYYEQ